MITFKRFLRRIKQGGDNAIQKVKRFINKETLSRKCHAYAKETKTHPVIGLVVTTFDKGGLEQVVLNLYHGYKNKGYQVFLLCEKNILGIMADSIAQNELLLFNSSEIAFVNLLIKHRITVLHYHYNLFFLEEAKRMGIKILYTMHNVYTWKDDQEINEYSTLLNQIDYVVPVSDFVSDYFKQRAGYSQDNIEVIYNGIRFDELDSAEFNDTISRDSLGIKPNEIALAFIATFTPTKAQIGMIGVMESILKKRKDIKLLLVGNVGDPRYYKEFQEMLSSSPGRDSIIVVEYFNHKYMGEFLRNTADVFMLPTLQEGCSNAVLEAVYCDKPMIISDVGNAKQVSYLESCIVVPAAFLELTSLDVAEINRISVEKDMINQKELVCAIETLASSLDVYKSKAKLEPHEKESYSHKYMIDKYVELIEELFIAS